MYSSLEITNWPRSACFLSIFRRHLVMNTKTTTLNPTQPGFEGGGGGGGGAWLNFLSRQKQHILFENNTEAHKKESKTDGGTCRFWWNIFQYLLQFVIWEFHHSVVVDQTMSHFPFWQTHFLCSPSASLTGSELSFFGFYAELFPAATMN